MQQQVFKVNNKIFAIYVFAIVIGLLPSMMILKPATSDGFALALMLLVLAGSLVYFLVKKLFKTITINSSGVVFSQALNGKTLKQVAFEDIRHIDLRSVGKNKILSITTNDRELLTINGTLYENFDDLVSSLNNKRPFDDIPIKIDMPLGQDIGHRVLVLIGIGVALFVSGLIIERIFVQAWHSSSENIFSWLWAFILFSMIFSYPFIRREKKASPFVAAIVSSLLLGGALEHSFLIANRLITEQRGKLNYYEFKYVEKDGKRQKWQPLHGNQLDFHDGYVHVADVWKGYNQQLVEGSVYKVAVLSGFFNDIAFPIDAFKKANEIPQKL
jgi:hypothetical protein